MNPAKIDPESVLAEAMLALEQCRVFIDVLKTYPRYAKDVDVLLRAPHCVPDFIQARLAIGDTEIEDAIALSSSVATASGLGEPAWGSALSPEPRHAMSSPGSAVLKLPSWCVDAPAANQPSFRLRVGAADDGGPGGAAPGDGVITEDIRQDGELFRVRYMRGIFSPRVQVEVRIEKPATLRAGDRLTIPLNAEGLEARIEIELEAAAEGLVGRGIFDLDWEAFSRSRPR
jgi:hypothetical protein